MSDIDSTLTQAPPSVRIDARVPRRASFWLSKLLGFCELDSDSREEVLDLINYFDFIIYEENQENHQEVT